HLQSRLAQQAIRRHSRKRGGPAHARPAPFPLIVFLLTFFWIAILPFFNLFARHIEFEADRFGLELTHQNHEAAPGFVRDVQSGYVALKWVTFFFFSTRPTP